jgi:hypothetical protein
MAEAELDEYDARLVETYLERNWENFLAFLDDEGESDPDDAAEDIMVGLDEIINER